MSRAKKIFAVVFLILILDLTGAFPASAATGCPIEKGGFDKLESVQNNPSLDHLEEIRLELRLRKELLKGTVDCAILEAVDLKTSVDKVRLGDRDTINLQSKFQNELDNAINYYKAQKERIDDLGLQGSKDFANSLALWREGNYKRSAKMAANFLIWAGNQSILKTAEMRVDQLGQSVTILKLVYNGDIQDLWRGADAQLSEAKRLNQKSRDDLALASPDDALASIKSSLDSLSKTYGMLYELVNAINKALSLPN